MTEIIDKVTVNKITKAKYNELVGRGVITPAMIKEQVWIFVDDQYVSEANVINWNSKQPALISGNNIKTINGQSVLGSGDLPIDTSGLDFKGYILNQNYINLKEYDLGVYYVMEGTTYSLVNNPGPNQRRMFNNYAIYLLTGYTLVINRNVDDIEAGEYFAYAYGLIDSNTGIQPQYVAFKKSASTSTYGFSFDIQNSQNRITRPLVYVNAEQTITSKKTFNVLPESSVVPQADEQFVNKKYVDDSIPTVPTNVSAFTNDAGYITGIDSGDVTTALGYTPVNPNIIGVAQGIAELDSTGKVPSAQLPSFVDDVIEGYYNTTDGKFYKESTYTTEIPGEAGKIYVDLTTNKTYRWGGSAFAEISESLALGTTSTTAFRGDYGEIAYLHSQSPHAPANAEANTIDSISVNNTVITPDSNKNVDITVPTQTSELNNDSGFITGMTLLSYGHSTWADFMDAYTKDKIVYCRASSNSNPGTGSQNRLAFMAYLAGDSANPTEVEFQYYRSVNAHTDSQQGDQMYVYKLNRNSVWSVTVRNSFSRVIAGANMTSSYANSAITLNAVVPTKTSDLTNDSGFIDTETDPVFSASPAAGITNQDITNWNNSGQEIFYVTEPCSASQPFNLSNRKKGIYIFPFEGAYYRDIYFTYDGTLSQYTYAKMLPGNNILYVKEDIPDFSDNTYIPDEYMAELSFIELDSTRNLITYTLGGVLYDTSAPHCYVDLVNTEAMTLQDKLVSGTNIKTINGNSLLGSGDITIQGGGGASIYDLSDLLAVTTPADQVYIDILADIQDNAEIRILNTISATQEELYTVIKSEYDPTPGVPSYVYYFDEQNKYTKLTLTDDGTDASITKSVENDFLFYNKALNSQTVSGWGSDIRCWINSNQWSSNKFVMEGKPTGIYLFDAIAPYNGSYIPQKIAGATNATGYLDVLGIQFMIIIKDYTSASAGETVALWWGSGKAGPQYGTLRKQAVNNAYPAGLQGGNDNNSSSEIYVNLLLAQTIAGKKTFTTLPETSLTPTKDAQLTRKKYVDDSIATKQDTLVSGTNIKTVNGNSLLGSGDIVISGGSQKYVGTITGDGTTTSFTITHNLDSRDVIVQVYDNTSYETVIVDVTRDTVNTVQIDFTTAPILDKVYKVVVM